MTNAPSETQAELLTAEERMALAPTAAPGEAGGAPLLSVVSPMYNEAGNVRAFVAAVEPVLQSTGLSYEILLVDDGSCDSTWQEIDHLAREHPHVRGISLSRNFGHQNALFCGLRLARGQAVISMDGDLQHPPSALPELIRAWREGAAVVNTRRIDGENTSWFKRSTSRWFYRVFSKLSGVKLDAGSSDFRLLNRRATDTLLAIQDADLFLRGLVSWMGFRSVVVPYQVQARHSGKSKYGLRRMLRFSETAILSFSVLPLRLGIWFGFAMSALSLVELLYILVRYFGGHTIPGWASIMTFGSLMFGVLFVLLGIIGVYLGKLYELAKRRPRYIVERAAGMDLREVAPDHGSSPAL